MFLVKERNSDIGMMFKDVHGMMKYFKDQIYADLQVATETNNFDVVAVLSEIFSRKLTFKQIRDGKNSMTNIAKGFYGQDMKPGAWGYKEGRKILDHKIESFFKYTMKSIPGHNGTKNLYKLEEQPNGSYIPVKMKWKQFFDEYFAKDSTILSEEEKLFRIQ